MTIDTVLSDVRHGVGRITLNAPRVINALDHPMIHAVYSRLRAWETDDDVRTVLIDGAGERGLCAGGNIREVYDSAGGDGSAALALWREEYRMNDLIGRYAKPVVALMHGLVLGGGVGISGHASLRVVTENSRVGMPEVVIGLVPDVGGTWLLSRAPGELGTHLAMTGLQAGPADAIRCGLADVHVPRSALAAIRESAAPADTVAELATAPAPGELAAQQSWIDQCYQGDSASDIVSRLAAGEVEAARRTAEVILSRSPTAVAVTLAAMRRARRSESLAAVLDMDYRTMGASLTRADLVEGVRAQIVDKDRNPRWRPATLAEVSQAEIERHFASRGDDELGLAESV